MQSLAVSAIGTDRPGIVATITGVLASAGCNLEDTSMSILRGEFAMMLVVAAPDDVDPTDLDSRLSMAAGSAGLDLVIVVRALPPPADTSRGDGEAWGLVVYGADRPGIVHRISSTLSGLGVNIVDLTTRLTDESVYSMVMEIVLPPDTDPERVRDAVRADAGVLGVEFALDPAGPTIF